MTKSESETPFPNPLPLEGTGDEQKPANALFVIINNKKGSNEPRPDFEGCFTIDVWFPETLLCKESKERAPSKLNNLT